MWQDLLNHIKAGDVKSLARAISLIENEVAGYQEFMQSLSADSATTVIGITGPPGAGKSTLTDNLIGEWVKQGKRVAVICVDPSSPFNLGALLGDRIRMSQWYDHPSVYIRSLASRGSLGGLHPMIIEITDVVKAGGFDYVIIETVGVGQSEVEIAGMADTTIVVLVPESGDEIQVMKAGLMEIADLFVVNKSDRPGADIFVKNLINMMSHSGRYHDHSIPVLKAVASENIGTAEIAAKAGATVSGKGQDKQMRMRAEKAFQLIAKARTRDISKEQLLHEIQQSPSELNLYQFIQKYIHVNA
jgi:LAO/AO transport system kinase